MGNEIYIIIAAISMILGYIGYNEKRYQDMLTRQSVIESRLIDKIAADKDDKEEIKVKLERLETKIDTLIERQLAKKDV